MLSSKWTNQPIDYWNWELRMENSTFVLSFLWCDKTCCNKQLFIILSYLTYMYLIEICWISLGNLIKNLNKYFCWMNVKNKSIVLHSHSDARQRVPRRWRWWRRGWWVRTEGRYVSIPPTQHVPPTLASCRWLCGAGDLRTAAHRAHRLQQDIYASRPGMNSFILDTINVSFGANLFNHLSGGLSSI